MKRFAVAITLSCILSGSALAGEMPMITPAPPPPQGASSSAAPGDIPSVPGDIPSGGITDQLSMDALSALLSVLGFLSV